MFNGSLAKKLLNLEKKMREVNCIGDKTPKWKTSQFKQRCGEENRGVKRVRVFLLKVDLLYVTMIEKKTLAY